MKPRLCLTNKKNEREGLIKQAKLIDFPKNEE